MNYILILVGFFILIKSASYLIDGSINIAKKYNISNLVIGLTIVAFGTSAPEIFINFISAVNGNTSLALGNIVGSNISNILLILGISSIIYPLKAQNSTVYKEVPFSLIISLALFFLIDDIIFSGQIKNILSFGDSIILILFFVIFLSYTYGIMKNMEEVEETRTHKLNIKKSIFFVILGIIGLALGAELIVRSTKEIASSFGISDTIIGLTIVALGSSLPELAASVTASLRKDSDIIIGNIVGSNIINIALGLSLTGIIQAIPLEKEDMIFVLIELLVTILLMISLYFGGKKGEINRFHGIIFILLYIGYISYISLKTLNKV